MIPRARVVAAPGADRATPMLEREVGEPRRLRALREEIDARLTAERLVREAEAAAEAILTEARHRALGAVATAVQEAQASVGIQLAAKWVALRQAEHAVLGRDADRAIAMAVALAERLLGASLALDPALIADLARAVLDEARGARRAVIEAHPLDADELRRGLTGDGLESALDRGAMRRGACARRA